MERLLELTRQLITEIRDYTRRKRTSIMKFVSVVARLRHDQ